MINFLSNYFQFEEKNTNLKTEIIGGLTTFLTMALAPGMGLNAFFTFSVCFGMDIPWQTALSGVLASGIIFIILSITGLREIVIKAIPNNLKYAVSAGIGLFIAFVGLKNAGIVVADPSTFVALGDLTDPSIVLVILGLAVMSALMVRGNKIAIFI